MIQNITYFLNRKKIQVRIKNNVQFLYNNIKNIFSKLYTKMIMINIGNIYIKINLWQTDSNLENKYLFKAI